VPQIEVSFDIDADGILNVRGLSDALLSVVAAFLAGESGHSAAELESVEV
jgi:molecular chaperone DnaK (HSP70)